MCCYDLLETEHPQLVMYSLYLYFLSLSLRNISNALDVFKDKKKSHMVLYKIGYKDLILTSFYRMKRISAFIIDEIIIYTGCKHV
jgi:hypothetical protein